MISQFFGSFEEVEIDEADDIIDMEYEDTLEQAVQRAAKGICPILDLTVPDEKRILEACDTARAYTAKRTGKKPPTSKPPRYFAFVPKMDLKQLLDKKMREKGVPESGLKLWTQLVEGHRLPDNPHVTIVHSKEKHEAEDLWEHCLALHKSLHEDEPSFTVAFDHVVWNGDIMALAVSKVEMRENHGKLVQAVVEHIPDVISNRLHLTVGTREEGINPFGAAAMVDGWRRGEDNGAQSIPLGKCLIEGNIVGRYS